MNKTKYTILNNTATSSAAYLNNNNSINANNVEIIRLENITTNANLSNSKIFNLNTFSLCRDDF